MKSTPIKPDKFRARIMDLMLDAIEKNFGLLEEMKSEYTEAEWRVLINSLKFEGVHEAVDSARIAVELLYDKWDDIVDLEDYLASGDWQKDYEAEERSELSKDIPKDVLSQDALYNDLADLDDVLKDMRRLLRHCKAGKKKEKRSKL